MSFNFCLCKNESLYAKLTDADILNTKHSSFSTVRLVLYFLSLNKERLTQDKCYIKNSITKKNIFVKKMR